MHDLLTRAKPSLLILTCLLALALFTAPPASAQDSEPEPEPLELPEDEGEDGWGATPPTERERDLERRLKAIEEEMSRLRAQPTPPAAEGEVSPVGSDATNLERFVKTGLAGVELHGLVFASYTHNFMDPPQRRRANTLRVNDLDHETFSIPYAKLSLSRTVNGENAFDAGFRLEVGAGTMVADVFGADPEFLQGRAINIPQAYVELQLPSPHKAILVQAGRVYGWFGVESLDLPQNPLLSLSYFSNFTPYTNTGVSAGMDLAGGFRYTQWLVNGWDLIVDNNDSKSHGGQLAWENTELGLWISANWLLGNERDDDESHLRWLLELDVIWTISPTTQLQAALHYGQEEGGDVRGPGVAKYGGVMLIGQQKFFAVDDGEEEPFHRFAVAGRTTYWRDQGGSKSGIDQALFEASLSFEVWIVRFASVKLEYRRDMSSERRAFTGHRGQVTRSHLDTISLAASLSF